jgi:hypothetical protein
VIRFLSEVRLATGHQLARRLWAATSPTDPRARTARRALARLEGWRVFERLGRRLGGVRGGSTSIVYGLGPAGRRLLIASGFVPRRLGAPGERYLAHAIAVTELVVRLGEADRAGGLEVITVQTEPSCWRGFLGAYGSRQTVKPDLFVRTGAGRLQADNWFVEVDLGSESAAAIARKADRYVAYWHEGTEQARHGVFPRVAFTTPDQRRGDQLKAALGRVDGAPEGLFAVWPYDEVIGRFAAEAQR